jgi:hypothetical protein
MLKTLKQEFSELTERVNTKYIRDFYGIRSPKRDYELDIVRRLRRSIDLIKSQYACDCDSELVEIEYLPEAGRSNITNVYNFCQTGGKTFVFTQSFASSVWVITHDLGYYPNVTTEDHIGADIEGVVTYVSENELTITFSTDFIGKAYLS